MQARIALLPKVSSLSSVSPCLYVELYSLQYYDTASFTLRRRAHGSVFLAVPLPTTTDSDRDNCHTLKPSVITCALLWPAHFSVVQQTNPLRSPTVVIHSDIRRPSLKLFWAKCLICYGNPIRMILLYLLYKFDIIRGIKNYTTTNRCVWSKFLHCENIIYSALSGRALHFKLKRWWSRDPGPLQCIVMVNLP